MTARFWVAQLVDDVFRDEPRNIGVFVEFQGETVTRLLGEDSRGDFDGRRLRGLKYPDVYRQWMAYWKKEIGKGAIENLAKLESANYRIRLGGEVSDVGIDTAVDIANYLYSMLVSEGGFREATASLEEVTEPNPVELIQEIAHALDQENILVSNDQLNVPVPHPVRRNAEVMGRLLTPYKPTFTQENGHLYVMETVDFTVRSKKGARDHAGWSAYMFQDIKRAHDVSETIAIVKVTDAERDFDEVRSGMILLRNEGHVVDWGDPRQRAEFLNERRRVAFA